MQHSRVRSCACSCVCVCVCVPPLRPWPPPRLWGGTAESPHPPPRDAPPPFPHPYPQAIAWPTPGKNYPLKSARLQAFFFVSLSLAIAICPKLIRNEFSSTSKCHFQIGTKNWTEIFASNFLGTSGISRQNPGISRQKVCLPGFRGTYRTFWPPPLHVEDPHPHIRTQKFGYVLFFLPDQSVLSRQALYVYWEVPSELPFPVHSNTTRPKKCRFSEEPLRAPLWAMEFPFFCAEGTRRGKMTTRRWHLESID